MSAPGPAPAGGLPPGRAWRIGLTCAVAANLVGGLTYPAQKAALEGLPPATVSLARNLVAMACMAGWMAARGGVRWGYSGREILRLTVLGVFAYALPLLLGLVGTRHSTAGNASILILLEPAAILVFSWLLLGESLRRLQVLGVAVGLSGALVLALEGASLDDLLAGRHLEGNLVLVLHGVLWGLYSPVMKPLAERHRAVDVTFAAMVLAQILLVPAAWLEWGHWPEVPDRTPAIGWTLALGVVGSFVGTVLWTYSLRWIAASTMAPLVFLQPFAGVVAGWLWLGESLSPAAATGGLLIGAGVLLVTRARAAERRLARAGAAPAD